MAQIRSSMELIWQNPPKFNFGYYLVDEFWHFYIMRRDSVTKKLVVRLLFAYEAKTLMQHLFIGTVCFRLGKYINEELSKVRVVDEGRQQTILESLQEYLKKGPQLMNLNLKSVSSRCLEQKSFLLTQSSCTRTYTGLHTRVERLW